MIVRETAPPRSLVATDGAGYRKRLGADEHESRDVPSDLSFSASAPGGSDALTLTLNRDSRDDTADLPRFADMQLVRNGGRTLRYRIESKPRDDTLEISGRGKRSLLEDRQDVRALFLDASLERWTGPSRARQIALLGTTPTPYSLSDPSVEFDYSVGLPALRQSIEDAWSSAFPISEAYYDSEELGIGLIYLEMLSNISGGTWGRSLYSSGADTGPYTAIAGLSAGTTYAGYQNINARYAMFEVLNSASSGGAAGATYWTDWLKLRVYGTHGLTRYGSDPGGFYTGQMLAWLIANKTALEVGSIDLGTFLHPHATYYTPGTALSVVEDLTRYEPLYDWLVFDEDFDFVRRGSGRRWKARVGSAGLEATGESIERAWNEIVVSVDDPRYGTVLIGPPGSTYPRTDSRLVDPDPLNAANAADVQRRALLDIGEGTVEGAPLVGQQFLAQAKLLDTSGRATLAGEIEDEAGTPWPVDEVLPADTIEFVDASDPSPRRVAATSCSDAGMTNSVDLDAPPQTLEALLSQLSAVLIPLN